MSRVIITTGEKSDKTVVLEFGDFGESIDVDELTKINYSNLYGEIVTVSALLNRIGILKSEAEAHLSLVTLDCDIYAAELEKRSRREANISDGKFTIGKSLVKLTESAISSAILLDVVYQNKRKAVINAKKNSTTVDSLYWSIQSKDKKLSVLIKSTTPEEFFTELLEGEINGIMITKPIIK